MGLSMNASKTQLLFSSRAGNLTETPVPVEVDGSVIHPVDTIELLGVMYYRKLSTMPHVKALLAAVRQRASVVARLANHLPRGEYLQRLLYGLVVGKFSHALAAVARPRLEPEDNASVIWSGIHGAFNNLARSIIGARRRDHVRIEDLLAQAGLESANRMVVKAYAAKTWGCFHSNHVSRLLFSDKRTGTAKTTRLAKTGLVKVHMRGGRHLFHLRGPHVEQVGPVTPGNHKGEGKKGGLRLCKPNPTLVLQDVTPRLRLVGCSLRVVGHLLRNVGRIPWDVERVRREAWHVIFCTVSIPSSFLRGREKLLLHCSTRNKQDIV
jgi:hypothetical protein